MIGSSIAAWSSDGYSSGATSILEGTYVSREENPAEPISVEGDHHPAIDGEIPVLQLLPFRQARTAMLVICVLLGLASVASLVCFGYQLNRLLATGGAYVPTTVRWPDVLGHL